MRILLQASPLLAETLALQLTRDQPGWAVAFKPDQLDGKPSLVIWSIEAITSLAAIDRETRATAERWPSTPLLLLLPDELAIEKDASLSLPAKCDSLEAAAKIRGAVRTHHGHRRARTG